MKMEKDIVDIIAEKEFIQLTENEKLELQEFCKTEEEYNQLKSVFASVNALPIEKRTPKSETKKDLDALFAQTYPKAAPIWYNSVLAVLIPKEKPFYRQPLLQVAAVALLIFLAVPLFNHQLVEEKNVVAKEDVKVTEQELVETKTSDNHETDLEPTENEVINEVNEQEQVIKENTLPMIDDVQRSKVSSRNAVEKDEEQAPIVSHFFDVAESDVVAEDSFQGNGAASPGVNHPDGIYLDEQRLTPKESLSISASESEDLLDLLTATF